MRSFQRQQEVFGACNRIWTKETRDAPQGGGEGAAWAGPAPGLLLQLRWGRGRQSACCQRGRRFAGWLERRVPVKIVHYLGEGLVFFLLRCQAVVIYLFYSFSG